LRLELPSNSGNPDAQIIVNNGAFSDYDPASNTVYKGKAPVGATGMQDSAKDKGKQHALPTVAEISSDLNKAAQHLNISEAHPTDVGDQPAYTVRVSPKHDGGLLGAAELAWDAVKGVPLRIAVYARNDSSPVLELKVTQITYGAVPASDFSVPTPSGAKVVTVNTPTGRSGASDHAAGKKHGKRHAEVKGVAAVAKQLKFTLLAPGSLVGLPRQSVTLLDWGGSPAALVTYGQNLGGIAVIERKADTTKTAPPTTTGGEHHRGLNLPTVSINGVTGQELDTALGTMVRFTRGGVSYIVVGSVPAAAADAAARAL
jgi:outer membrane lipoprotein-sorting protein